MGHDDECVTPGKPKSKVFSTALIDTICPRSPPYISAALCFLSAEGLFKYTLPLYQWQ